MVLLMLAMLFPRIGQAQKKFMVCGDSKLLIVNYDKSEDNIPDIEWKWDAHEDATLPLEYRQQKFNSMDDCKASKDGKEILVASSSGAIALIELKSKKVVFVASVPNAHSIEFLPNGYIAAAASTDLQGNKVMVFNPKISNKAVATDSLYSAHGVVWDEKSQILYALGFDVLRAYKLNYEKGAQLLEKINEWRIPGKSGHDLFLTADSRALYITEHTNAWKFDILLEKFIQIADFPVKANIKSIGRNRANQIIYTEPEESWWTFSVNFLNPERKFIFPTIKVYKARWFEL